MSAQLRGNQIGGLVRQTGDSLNQLDDGSWEGTVVYICRWLQSFYLAPQRNIAGHPDFPSLICTRSQVERLKPGIVARITSNYRGFFGSETTPPAGNETEEIITGTSDAPIETHPDFVAVLGGTKAAPLNGAIYDDDGKFKGWKADSRYAGIESYLIPSTVYRRSTPSRVRPTSIVGVGHVASVPIGVSDSANWLFTAKTWRRDGGVYSVTSEYMLSGPGGWDDTIYS